MPDQFVIVWTFRIGAPTWLAISAEVPAQGPFYLGRGFFGYVVESPEGVQAVAESVTGALIGPDLESVHADIAAGDIEVMRRQQEQSRKDLKGSQRLPAEAFWRMWRGRP